MTPQSDEVGQPSRDDLVPGAAVRDTLIQTVTRSFGIPDADAREIVRQACIALFHARLSIDPERWLCNVVCDLAREYWRSEPPADASPGEAITFREVNFTKRVLSTLSATAREALRLRYHEGRTLEEIAQALNVAPVAARRMIEKSLAKILRAQEVNR